MIFFNLRRKIDFNFECWNDVLLERRCIPDPRVYTIVQKIVCTYGRRPFEHACTILPENRHTVCTQKNLDLSLVSLVRGEKMDLFAHTHI